MTHYGPGGELTVKPIYEELFSPEYCASPVDVRIADIRVKFCCPNGERFVDLKGVEEWLNKRGWPLKAVRHPDGTARIGVLVTDVLPPPALSPRIGVYPGYVLWRLKDIEEWRKS